jgi:hypothetical protein
LQKFGRRPATGIAKPGLAAWREETIEHVEQRIDIGSVVCCVGRNNEREPLD